jgi:hypothetical protein
MVTVIIWILTQRQNRKSEIFKERLKRRMEMFDGLFQRIVNFNNAYKKYQNNNSLDELQKEAVTLGNYRQKIFCYGTEEEYNIYCDLIKSIDESNTSLFLKKHAELVDLARKNLRIELDYN